MNKEDLPKEYKCLVCDEDALLQDLEPNECVMSVAQFLDSCTECYDSYVAVYECKNEHYFYVPYDIDEDE